MPTPQVVASGVDASGRAWYQYDDGVSTHAVPNPVIEPRELPPLSRAGLAAAAAAPADTPLYRQAQNWLAAQRASDQAFYTNSINNADSAEGAIAGAIGRALNNAGYDAANGVVGLFGLATDGNLRSQVANTIATGVENTIAHPIDTAVNVSNAAASYWNNNSVGQMGEDALRMVSGGLATAGLGKAAGAVGGVVLDATGNAVSATATWLAPKAAEMAESFLVRTGGIRYAIEPGPSISEVADTTAQTAFRENFIGPRIGRVSGFINSTEFADASYLRYQNYVNDAYDVAQIAESKGLLRGNPNTRVGAAVDRDSAIRYLNWLSSEGLSEGAGGVVQVNRWLRDPAGTGFYVRPDIRVPSAGVTLDATVGMKWNTDRQIMRFSNFSGNDRITIVRPQQLGGSYSIWP